MKVFIKGLNSCAMRKQKVEQYRQYLAGSGWEVVERPGDADRILLWTCAFRADIRDMSIEMIHEFSDNYEAEVVVAGCLPDIDPELVREHFDGTVIPWNGDGEVMEKVFGNGGGSFCGIDEVYVEPNLCADTAEYRRANPEADATFHDQFIKLVVSEGCNYECSYCSERLAFPEYHSFSEESLVERCREQIARTGHKKIILLADSLGDYGVDRGGSLVGLIERLTGLDEGVQVALNNLNPTCFMKMFDELVGLVEGGSICHLNLPIQSACEKVLRLMKRQYSVGEIERIFSRLNEIGFSEFDTHVIVGFPGETDADFDETVKFLLRHRPKYVLGSKFMVSKNMDAYKLGDRVSEEVKSARSRELYRAMEENGILVNTDDSELSKERLRRISLV